MPRRAISSVVLAVAATTLAGCGHNGPVERPEPEVRVVEKVVTRSVPCPALAELAKGKPAYPDTDEAIREAENFVERAYLYATGRKLRMAREAEYEAVAAACDF